LIVNNHPVFVKSRIEEEGAQHRRTLLACLRHEKMSSTNLTAAINACTHIAKTRPLLTAEVIDGTTITTTTTTGKYHSMVFFFYRTS